MGYFWVSCQAGARKPITEIQEEPSNAQVKVYQQKPVVLKVEDIPPPIGYYRVLVDSNSFGSFLRSLPLKAPGSPVMLYDGNKKWNQEAHFAVVDLPIGKRDLHQCADAVMRIRADYLRKTGQPESIHFNFTNGFNCDYRQWMQGKRIRVSGNDVSWYNTNATTGDSDASYWKYLEMVWSYAGTLSLEKELVKRPVQKVKIGDVWIKGGSPGHAIMVVDLAMDKVGRLRFLLAQSYMPAQEMHILVNPNDENLSPWYRIPENALVTPEWTFTLDQLRTW